MDCVVGPAAFFTRALRALRDRVFTTLLRVIDRRGKPLNQEVRRNPCVSVRAGRPWTCPTDCARILSARALKTRSSA